MPANPTLRLGRYLRVADEPEPEIDPFTREDGALVLAMARERFPEWYPWLLCGLRTGMRAGELLALQWGDINWRSSRLEVRRNLVRGQLTTPKITSAAGSTYRGSCVPNSACGAGVSAPPG